MYSQITVLPASTQAGKEAIRYLLKSSQEPLVRGIYRDPSKAPAEFTENSRFKAIKGDVARDGSLDFTDSTALFYIPPPTFDGTDQATFATKTAMNVASALQEAACVERLLVHSALGAQNDPSFIGVLKLNHITDHILKPTAPEVILVQPCNYYQNWGAALQSMQADPPRFEFPFSPADFAIPMISVKDVGKWCAEALLDESDKREFKTVKLFGPRFYSSLDVKKAIETVTGKEGELITIPKDGLAEYWRKIVPEAYVQDFVDFSIAQLKGGVLAHEYDDEEETVKCETELVDALREMASQ